MYNYDERMRALLQAAAVLTTAVGALLLLLLMFLFWPHKKSANDARLQGQLDKINDDFEAGRISYEEFQRQITEAKSSFTQ